MTAKSALFVGDISVDLTMVIPHVPAPDEKVHVATVSEAPGGVVANASVAAARAGATVRLLLVTSGDKGSSDPTLTPAEVAAMREREARIAAERLGCGIPCRHPKTCNFGYCS